MDTTTSRGRMLARNWRWIVGLIAALGLVLTLASANPLTQAASGQAKKVVASTIVVYAALRTLNAALSAAQEVEVGGAFVVTGSVQPLKTLEPLDDTVEAVAGMVLSVAMLAGALGLGFAPVTAVGFVLAGVGALAWRIAPAAAARCLWLGVLLALALPAAFIVSDLVGGAMTRQAWAENRAILDEATGTVTAASPAITAAEAPAETGWWDSVFGGEDETAEASRGVVETLGAYRAMTSALLSDADRILGSYVELLAVYAVRLILLPLVLIGVVIVLMPRGPLHRAA